METNDMIAPILVLVGGILTLITVLPVISDFLPLATGSGGTYINFYGISGKIGGVTVHLDIIKGWTLIGLSGMLWVIVYAILGILGIIVGANAFAKFIPNDNLGGMPLMGLVGVVTGILNIVFDVLIFIGDSNSLNNYGFSPAPSGSALGLGFFALIIGGVLLLVGGILNFVMKSPS